MIPIIIEPESLPFGIAGNSDMIEKVMDSVVKDITASFAREWEKEAQNALHSTRSRYLNNLHVIDTGRMEGAVVLDYSADPMIRMIEEGASAFDLKEGFRKSSKKKLKADGGWYLTIPFRHSTPGSIGESSVFSNKMPKDIYSIVKNKKTNIDVPGGGRRSSGLQIGEIPAEYKTPNTNAQGEVPESKAFKSIYEGVIKVRDSKTDQSMYMSFRKVSDKSLDDSWTHPGIDTHNLAGRALSSFEQNAEAELNHAVNKILDTLGF